MPDRRPRRRRILGVSVVAALLSGASLAAAGPASAAFRFATFATEGDATAGFVDVADAPPGSTDQQSIRLFVNGSGPTDFNDAAIGGFTGFSPTPNPVAPTFDFRASIAGGSGGSVRFVMRFNDGGRGDLRAVTLIANQWTHVDGAGVAWDNVGGACGSRNALTYQQMLACHPGASLTDIELINDSGWLHPGGFEILADNVRYEGVTVSTVPPPELGHWLDVTQLNGSITVSGPATASATANAAATRRRARLVGTAPIPVGTVVDAASGRVHLVSARPGGGSQAGNFLGGKFQARQSPRRSAGGLTDLVLQGSLGCNASGSRAARASGAEPQAQEARRRRRRLWGRGRGRFRTRGRYSSASVRGTKWLTQDSCAGTLTVVRSGVVLVRDFRLHKTVVLTAGGRYFAHAR